MYRIALMSDTAAQDMIPSLILLSHKVHVFPLDTAHTTLESEAFDLLMVDARTALVKARQCAQLLRATGVQLPLIALLNEGGMAAVAASWQVDDIVSDQASPSEMDARLRLAIKSDAAAEEENSEERIVRAGNLIIDTQAYSAHLSGTALNLTFKEFELLKFMAQHPGRVFSRAQLLSEVWGYDSYYGGTRTVDVHVRRLRSKLGTEYEQMISTVRNVGYSFNSTR